MHGTVYHLRVRGFSSKTNEQLFDEIKLLDTELKYFSIFIQTDKATYKPGAIGTSTLLQFKKMRNE